jgi:hypothetical protein
MNPKTTPKDFFLHLGATVALYAAAIALINLSFSVINYFLPDALAGYYYANSIAWPISMLLILVPILYLLEWLIGKDIAKAPEKKEVWIRRWRIYLTLFLTAILIGGDLIALINTYLNGEITARFAYKILVILLVASSIGKYYFFSIADSYKWARTIRRLHVWFGLILVAAAIVSGFLVVGSPAKQRGIRMDNQRISDLSNIQWQIVSQWQQKGALPSTLAGLNDSISGFVIPTDPDTKAQYGYTVNGRASFELCADFSLATQDTKGRGAAYGGVGGSYGSTDMIYPSYPYPGGVAGDSWEHPAGHACFARTIDPTRYPVNPKPSPAPLDKTVIQ